VRYLILSDLHANWEALERVLRKARGSYDRVLCCGDLVDYGADPNAVVEWVRANCAAVIRGNHDTASTSEEFPDWFNPAAQAALMWTRRALTEENRAYLRNLPQGPLPVEDFQLVHGSPADEDEYVLTAAEAIEAFGHLETRVGFVGHTHLQGGYILNRGRVETIPPPAARLGRMKMELEPECFYLINPGSVGQPRDRDPRAAFAVYDTQTRVVEYRRVSYDVEEAQRKIREAGLPAILADRLAVGR